MSTSLASTKERERGIETKSIKSRPVGGDGNGNGSAYTNMSTRALCLLLWEATQAVAVAHPHLKDTLYH